MAIYHCSIKIGSRSSGRSAVAAAAYRSGEKLEDRETGLVHDYTKKSGVIYSEIMLPPNAPREYMERERLWNAVQEVEKQSNAQLFREVEVALPKELTRAQQLQVVRAYVYENFVKEGMCADWALHDKGDGNPHAHIMLTMRGIKENGEWDVKERKVYALNERGERIPIIDPKTGEQKIGKNNRKMWKRETVQANNWNDRSKAEEWRAAWAARCNQLLDQTNQIDHRSYERQGIDLEPTYHVGVTQKVMKEKGKHLDFDKPELNEEIRERNSLLIRIKEQLIMLANSLAEIVKEKGESQRGRIGELLQRSRDARGVGRIEEERKDERGIDGGEQEMEEYVQPTPGRRL